MRQPYTTRPFLLKSEQIRERLILAIRNLPLDEVKPLEIVIREQIKGRRPDANAAMWAGPLRDIADQAWVEGQRHSAEVWHEYFKRELLPEEFDPERTKEGYAKWSIDPGGNRILIGSTTQLTVKGFAEYLTAVEAFGASLGVLFSANPNEGR